MSASAKPDLARTGPPIPVCEILGLMAKYWTPGEVKTRLGAAIGHEIAAGLHRRFVIHLCTCLAETGDRREVVVAPPSRIDSMTPCVPQAWRLRPQSDGDLGVRMRTWFDDVLENKASNRAVLIGADCPNLKPDETHAAFHVLGRHDVVLGPADDGGYYLIGLRGPMRAAYDPLFTDIPWSREGVFEITRRRIEQAGLSVGVLSQKSDVDNIADLNRLRRHLQTARRYDGRDAQLADEINRLLDENNLSSPT